MGGGANTRDTPGSGRRSKYRCSFCDKKQDEVERLIAGRGGIFICDECVELCSEIIAEERLVAQAPEQPSNPPRTLAESLSDRKVVIALARRDVLLKPMRNGLIKIYAAERPSIPNEVKDLLGLRVDEQDIER